VSGWWVPVFLAFGVAGGALAWRMLEPEPMVDTTVASTNSVVDGLVDQVYELAALAYYVYPPVHDREADTAYKILIELETLGDEEALSAAALLRTELASTLVRLGDEMWGKPGGEPFALDFYVQAIVFDPAIEPARTRAMMSPGELLALRRKAGAGDFTESELIAVEPLQALSSPNPADTRAKLEKIKTRHRSKRRASAVEQLDALIEEFGPSTPSKIAPPEPAPVAVVRATKPSAAASKLVRKADVARKSARLQEAEQLYHKALRIEQHRVDALTGLGRVYFEQGKYASAVTYFNLAVRRSGRDADLRIALGDAYLKTLEYEQALEQYKKAKKLGGSKADDRIARVKQRTGG
jgi:tetratricopeptide (TPR) repeat protein